MAVASDAFVVAGRYEVGDLLGRGGMGEVRRARDLRLNRDVAIKFLRTDLAAQPDARQRFEHEARNAARLNHPNVVAVLDSGEHAGQPFLVMECLPGHTLRDELRRGPVDPNVATWVGQDVAAALTAAHAVGIVHRDVTPANILLTDTGRAKLADFGIAKAAETDSVTTVGQVIGTPAFLAPERLRGEEATPATDIYGLGATLNAAVGARTDELGRDLAVLIDQMMDPDPSRRPTAQAALAALEGTGSVEPETTVVAAVAPAQPTLVTEVVRPRVPPWRDRWVRLATIGVVALLGILLLLATSGGGSPGSTQITDETPVPTTSVPVPTTFAPVPSVQTNVDAPVVDIRGDRDDDEGKGKAKGRKERDD